MSGLFKSTTISTADTRINSMRIQQSAYGLAVPLVYGTNRVASNMVWYGDFKSTAHTTTQKSGGKGGKVKTKNTTYTYSASMMLGLCENKIHSIAKIWRDKEQILPKVESGITLEPIDQINFELFNGDANPVWGYLESNHTDQAIRYPYLGYVACSNYELGGSASLSNHNFEVVSDIKSSNSPDANPADVIYDLIKNPRYGAAPHLRIADLSEFRSYCTAANLLISPVLSEQREAFEIINEIVEAVNCAVVPSADGLKIRALGDSAITANGVTFTPNLNPEYHLNDDDFLSPVRVRRSRDTDAYNHVQVEYNNRHNQYNTDTTDASDQANIEMFGLKTKSPVKYDFFCEPSIARHAVQLVLQRGLHVRNEYEFELGWKYCRLEPMDIVMLTDEQLGLIDFPVRIIKVIENSEGELSITAIELAVGSHTAITYDLQSGNGYQGGNEEPGNVNAPVIFEPPMDLTNGVNEIWIAVSGGTNWGGCNVWASIDSESYEMIGSIFGSARYGHLVGSIDSIAVSAQVQLNDASGQMFSGTTADAEVDATLVKIGNEYLNYETATLDGLGLYTLTGLHRERFSNAQQHDAGAPFVRIDKAIFEHEISQNLIGKQIYLKFTSFNGLEQKEQTLDEVDAFSYTVLGGQTSGVAGLSLQSAFVGTSFKVQWQNTVGATGYKVQIWSGSVMLREIETTNTDYSYSIEEAKIDGVKRSYTVRVASKSGSNTSHYAELNVSNPAPEKLHNIYTSATNNSISVNWNPSNAVDLKDYQVWISTQANFDPENIAASWAGTAQACNFTNLQSTRTYYIRVAARDVWEQTTWNYSDQIAQSTSN